MGPPLARFVRIRNDFAAVRARSLVPGLRLGVEVRRFDDDRYFVTSDPELELLGSAELTDDGVYCYLPCGLFGAQSILDRANPLDERFESREVGVGTWFVASWSAHAPRPFWARGFSRALSDPFKPYS